MKLLLIRHGLTDWVGKRLAGRTPGIHLNEVGRTQAEALAEHLALLPLAAIYSSPQERALETAQPLSRLCGLTPRPCDGLAEVDCGDWVGRPLEDLKNDSLWPMIRTHPSAARFPGGESLREARDRAVAALDSIRDAHRDQFVAVFSHADPIRLAAAHYAGLALDLFQRLVISPASVTAFDLRELGPRLLCLNATGDLLALLLEDTHTPRLGQAGRPSPGGDRSGTP